MSAPVAHAEQVERFRAGHWAVIAGPGGDVVVGRRGALVRTRVIWAGAGLVVAYLTAALALGLWLYMIVIPTGVGLLVTLVRAARESKDRRLLAAYWAPRTPIYGPPVQVATAPRRSRSTRSPAPAPARPGPSYGAAWRRQPAVESGRYLPGGSR